MSEDHILEFVPETVECAICDQEIVRSPFESDREFDRVMKMHVLLIHTATEVRRAIGFDPKEFE